MAPPPQRSNNPAFAAHQENLSTEVVGKRPPSVIVVGSGIAGLAAARALRHASFEVTVLESRDQIGGRICTDYSFGFPVDLGASWLHGVSPKNPLGALIGRLGLPLYRTSGDNSVLYDHDLESCCLFEKDGSKVSGGLVMKVGEIFGEYLEETKKLRLEYRGDMSMRKAFSLVSERRPDLRLEGLEAKVFQWYICRMEGWFSSDADYISLQGWDEEELLEGGHGLMVKGYSPLVLALAASLDIRFNHRVTKVVRRFHRVQVFTEDGKVLNADAAVITVPLGVLKAKTINFVPRLPEWKEAAITDLGIGNENKIAMLFKTACWPNVDFLGVVAPSSYECSYFLNLHKATGHPVLVYMPAGRLADSLEKKSDKDAANFAIIELKKILPHVSEPVKCLVSHWGTDRNTLGSYSFDSVGKPHDLYERMRVPVDNLFFAGEATSIKFPGTVHGAFSTGLMAAEECRNKFMEYYGDLELFQPVMAEEELSGPATPIQISRL